MASSWKHRSRTKVISSEGRSAFPPDSSLTPEELSGRRGFLEIVENRLRDDPETQATLDRLVEEGISEWDAKLYLGHLASREVYSLLHDKVKIERDTYLEWLKNLPNLPKG